MDWRSPDGKWTRGPGRSFPKIVVPQEEKDSFLAPSLPESYQSVVTYSDTNWNQVWVKRQVVLRPDSSVPGLNLSVIRSLPLQIDYTLGNRNGIPDEPLTGATSFKDWIAGRLQYYITTDSFLTTDGLPYNSTLLYSTANVTVEYKPNIANLQAVYINTTAAYRTMDTPPIPSGYDTYYVNITTPNDTNTTVYQNQSVVVDLPFGYEMVAKKIKGTIKTYGYTTVTVDPGLGTGTSEIDMTVRKSKNGTARAAVTGPAGYYHVFDDSDANYTAVVSSTAGSGPRWSTPSSVPTRSTSSTASTIRASSRPRRSRAPSTTSWRSCPAARSRGS